ncbi:MAG TPA: YdcF family protein [Stellaceae bacterium]|nr:YdcF family protein [Stellaceae bacterium]
MTAADPSPKGIIVVLGNESNRSGLSEAARKRCIKAAQIAQKHTDYLLLPTGSYGAFNSSDCAHGELLREYLVELGVKRERVLRPTNSSSTVEDALTTRRIIVDLGQPDLVVVTSNFHLRRAAYVFRRVFPDFKLEFCGSDDPVHAGKLHKRELDKLEAVKAEWVDVPLYGLNGLRRFPKEIYENASKEHKHYDTLSIAVISGIFVIFGFPYIVSPRYQIMESFLFLLSSGGIVALLILYDRMAFFARLARRVLRHIEAQHDGGFSLSNPRQYKSGHPHVVLPFVAPGLSITCLISATALIMALIQLAAFLFLSVGGQTRL